MILLLIMKAYQRCPDLFELIVNSSFINKLILKQKELSWGFDQTQYCYFNHILIGNIADFDEKSDSFYSGRKIKYHTRFVIKLTPTLENNIHLDFPSLDEFNLVLKQLLFNSEGWDLLCEFDCDQHPINEIEPSLANISNKLDQVKVFCSGNSVFCPTFISRKNI